MKRLLLPLCLSIAGCHDYEQSIEQGNNTPPVLDAGNRDELSLVEAFTDRTTTISVLASDKDGDALTYSLLGNPDWVSMDGNVLTMKPLSENIGTYQFKIIVSDGAASTEVNVSLTIQVPMTPVDPDLVNHAPIISPISTIKAVAGKVTTVDVIASDKDGDTMTYSLVNNPSWVSINGKTITVNPTTAHTGNHQFKVKVSDGSLASEVDAALVVGMGFVDLITLRENIPKLPENQVDYAYSTYNSFVDELEGNDGFSTKKRDLLQWYDDIPHSENSRSNLFKEYNLAEPVFVDVPNWNVGEHYTGIINKKYLENALAYYNFMRSLSGSSSVYLSAYKQIFSQSGSWSGLKGGHGPSKEEAIQLGISDTLFDFINTARRTSNLWGERPDKLADYNTINSLPLNSATTHVWNESSHSGIANIGHRNTFMSFGAKDVGMGLAKGFSYNWMTYGSDGDYLNGAGLGGEEQQAILDAYPSGKAPHIVTYPSHGFYPFFVYKSGNQSLSLSLNDRAEIKLVTPIVKDEVISVKMELFSHTTDKLTDFSHPLKSIVLGDIGLSSGSSGATGPGIPGVNNKQWADNCTDACPEGVIDNGGYHFSASKQMRVRMPLGWFNEINENFTTGKFNYYTVRYSFDSKKADGSAGDSLKVIEPFYQNLVGDYLTLQTTYFDILTHR